MAPNLRLVRKSELSQDLLSQKSVISIKGEKEFEFKFNQGVAEKLGFSSTQPLKLGVSDSNLTGDAAEEQKSLFNSKADDDEPFSMSQSASVVLGSKDGTGNLLSSR